MKNNLLHEILNFIEFLILVMEIIIIYTFVACCVTNSPFPAWLPHFFISFIVVILLSIVLMVINKIYIIKEGKRRGYVKFSTGGKMYFQK